MEKKGGFFARHRFAIAVTLLMGTTIGAGILGIPYAVAKAGVLYGFVLIVILGLAFLFLNLFLGEIVLRTKEQHQLPGYAEKYLGRWGKRIMAFSMFIGLYGALTAYLIGEGTALQALFKFGTPFWYILLFFVIVSGIIYLGIKATGNAELILISLLFLVVAIIAIFSYTHLQPDNFTSFNLAYAFLPYGVILFAYIGLPAIPELREELEQKLHRMKNAIIIGSLLPIFLYVVFTFFIVGIVGTEQFELLQPNERIATVALSIYSIPILGIFANILAVLAMFTSFLTIGLALVEIYQYDYGLRRRTAFFLAVSLPLFIALLNLTTFIEVLGITGAIAGGLGGMLIVLMYWKAKGLGDRTPEYSLPRLPLLGWLLITFFALGIAYQLWLVFF